MRKKIYRQSKSEVCPFCGKTAITTNKQKIPVCMTHRQEELQNLKCSCGEYLDLAFGKYGPFYTCMCCGAINFNKALELNGYPLQSIDDL